MDIFKILSVQLSLYSDDEKLKSVQILMPVTESLSH